MLRPAPGPRRVDAARMEKPACAASSDTSGKSARDILLEGLKRLEYRGYDSAGHVRAGRRGAEGPQGPGRIANLEQRLERMPGHERRHHRHRPHPLGHPRRAQRGQRPPAHRRHAAGSPWSTTASSRTTPRSSSSSSGKGHVFTSQTDTEVLAHLIGGVLPRRPRHLEQAVQAALREVSGTYGIAVMCADEPDKLVAARKGSPLIVGVGDGRVRRRLRRLGHHRAHRQRGLPQRQRDGRHHPRRHPDD